MKLNRLLEITTILLNKRTVTAAELAERFGVSTRTIYRDINVLSASGVSVYPTQGTNGGISILEDYTVNRTVLSNSEKLGSIFKNTATDWISIDFSPWGADPNAYNKFTDIKTAITSVVGLPATADEAKELLSKGNNYNYFYDYWLPQKRLAVCSGLAEYGRNNICFVDGMGSLITLFVFISDMPCDNEYTWREVKNMDICNACNLCQKNCPTGAILADRG